MFKPINLGTRRLAVSMELLALAAFVGILAWGGITLTKETGRVAAMWLPNGAVLALLMSPKRYSRLLCISVAFIANTFANLATGDSPVTAAIMSLFNSFEVIVAAVLFKWAVVVTQTWAYPAFSHDLPFLEC